MASPTPPPQALEDRKRELGLVDDDTEAPIQMSPTEGGLDPAPEGGQNANNNNDDAAADPTTAGETAPPPLYNYPPMAHDIIGRSGDYIPTQPSFEVVTGVPVDLDDGTAFPMAPGQPQDRNVVAGPGTPHHRNTVLVIQTNEAGQRTLVMVNQGGGGGGGGADDDLTQQAIVAAMAAPPPLPPPDQIVNEELLLRAMRMCRNVSWAAIAEFILSLLFIFGSVWFAVFIPFPIVGYLGARTQRALLIFVFALAFPFMIGMRLYLAVRVYHDQSGPLRIILLILTGLCVVSDFALLFIVGQCVHCLKQLSEEEVQALRDGYYVEQAVVNTANTGNGTDDDGGPN